MNSDICTYFVHNGHIYSMVHGPLRSPPPAIYIGNENTSPEPKLIRVHPISMVTKTPVLACNSNSTIEFN